MGLRIQRYSPLFPKLRRFPILVYSNFYKQIPLISVTDEASDFKFGKQLGFAKARHIITSRKSGRGPGPGERPKIWMFFNICAMVEAGDFNFGA